MSPPLELHVKHSVFYKAPVVGIAVQQELATHCPEASMNNGVLHSEHVRVFGNAPNALVQPHELQFEILS